MNRKLSVPVVLLCLLARPGVLMGAGQPEGRPNFVVVLTDDK